MKKVAWLLMFLLCVSVAQGLESEIEDTVGLVDITAIKQKINSISAPGKIVIKIAKSYDLHEIVNAASGIGDEKECVILVLYEKEKDNLHLIFNCFEQIDEKSLGDFLTVFRIGVGDDKEYYTPKFIELLDFIINKIAPAKRKAPAEKLVPKNIKNLELYTDKTVFIISDKITIKGEDWDKLLSFIPVAIWLKSDEKCNEVRFDELKPVTMPKCAYPYLIYHEEGGGIDADAVINFIRQYQPDTVYHLGFPNSERINKLLSSVVDTSKIKIKPVSDYFDFWKERNIIVLSENAYETGLIAAFYASYLNAPLIFDKADSSSIIKNREVHTIGKVDLKSVKSNAKNVISFENPTDALLTLQYKLGISPDRVIITNPNDIKEDTSVFEFVGFTPVYPERHYEEFEMQTMSGRTYKQYYQNSLLSPYLAVAKDEILLLLPKDITALSFDMAETPEDWGEHALLKEKATAVKNAVISGYEAVTGEDITKNTPTFFTIIGSPRSIYLSYLKERVKIGTTFVPVRVAADRFYFDFNEDGLEDGNVGRIAGNIPDVSSVIASSVFFDRLASKETNFLGIGNSYTYSENLVSNVVNALKQKKIDSTCFIANKYYNVGDVCIVSYEFYPPDKPPLEQFERSNFIFFAGQGHAYKWQYALNSKDLPDLNLGFGLSGASDTNEYYSLLSKKNKKNQLPFGLTWLRKGGIAYVGSIQSESSLFEHLFSSLFLNKYSSEKYLGEILRESVAAAGKSDKGYAQMVLLGDPTLKLPYTLNIDLPFAWAFFSEEPFATFPEFPVGITRHEAGFRVITFSEKAIADITLDISELPPRWDLKLAQEIKMKEIVFPEKYPLSEETGINTSLHTGMYGAEWFIDYVTHNFYLAKAVITTATESRYTAYFKPFGAEAKYQESEEAGE